MAITKVTQKDLDLIRVEAEDVTTIDDKYFFILISPSVSFQTFPFDLSVL